MYQWKKTRKRWLAALLVVVLIMPFVQRLAAAAAAAQTGVGRQPLGRSTVGDRRISKFTVPPTAGTAIVRGRYTSESLRLIQAIAKAFPSKDKLDVASDDHASFGRFCDNDAPFHVVICEGDLTPHHKQCWQRRFPAGTPQPEAFMVGQLRVVFVANKSNPIESLDFAGIRKALNPTGKTSQWQNVGGAGTAAIRCYGPPEKTWARQVVRDKCMSRWRDADTPGVRELQRLGFRDDLTACTDAKEILAKVRSDRHALGFFACCGPLTKHDLQGVKALPIVGNEGGPAVAPPLDLTIEQAYPLAEPLVLYVHPNAPAVARDFCKFATGAEAAKIVQQSGIWPEYLGEKARGQQRVAEVKAGNGTAIVVCDLTGCGDVLKDLSLEFVKAKAAVQLKFQKGETRDTVIEKLAKGATELLLADGPITEGGRGTEGSRPHPDPLPKGEGKGTASPQSPRSIELGRTAVAVIVHPENPLESLPIDEARSIFCGEVKKWPAVRGAAAAMHVFGLKHTDPTTQLLKESFNRDPQGSARHATLKYAAQPDNEKVILAVARDPAAIGFVDLSQLPPSEKSVKLVPVFEGTGKGKAPTSNPLSRTLMLYVSPNASQVAKDFTDFLTPEHCKETIAQYNLLPPLHAEGARLAKAKPARVGPQIDLASADEPLPLLLEDPDAPQGQVKPKKLAAKPKPVIPAPEQPAPLKVTADAQPAPETESEPQPTRHPGLPSLSDDEIVWLVGGIVGVVLLAIGVGWLRAPHRKRKRR